MDSTTGPVVQRVDSAILCPADKCCRNQLRYVVDSNLSKRKCSPSCERLGPEENGAKLNYLPKLNP